MPSAPHPSPKAMTRLLLAVLLLFAMPFPSHAERATLLIPDRPSVEAAMDNAQGLEAAGNGKAAPGETTADMKDKGKKTNVGTTGKTGVKAGANAAGKAGKAANGSRKPEQAEEAPQEPKEAREHVWSVEEVCTLVDNVSATLSASLSPQELKEEVNLLVVGMEPSRHEAIPMDPPRILTIYRFDGNSEKPEVPVMREDRLGDIEETHYLNQKAWGANVGLARPGLYQFVIETQPWWSAENAGFAQHVVKSMVPVHGESAGWEAPLGLAFEIVPRTRPFGLFSPSLFSGTVLVNGRPEKGLKIHIFRINTEDETSPTPWHEEMVALSGEDGVFSVVLNRPGWWCCMATREGAPLKSRNGQLSPLRLSTLFWLYVDAAEK